MANHLQPRGSLRAAPASGRARESLRPVAAAGLAVALLAGCAATVRQPATATATAPLAVPAASSRTVALNVTGSPVSTGSEDWEPFKGEWRGAMAAAAGARDVAFSNQDGPPRPTGRPGTLVVVDVADYRYLTPGARFGFGVMTGNAYIDARVRYLDLATGVPFGERSYNTSSSAWQGAFSAMTDKQVRAISDAVIADINPR